MSTKETEIKIQVALDENHVPESIRWTAAEGRVEGEEAKAAFLYVWNESVKEMLKLDLWTKEMPLDSMKKFFHQILISMAQTYARATDEQVIAIEFENFAARFAKKSKIL